MNNNEIPLKEYENDTPKFIMIKYHVFIVFVLGILLLFLLLAGKFGGDSIPFILFTMIMSLPIIIIYRNTIPEYIPKQLSNLLLEEPKPKTEKVEYESILNTKTTKSKQVLYIIGMIIITIFLVGIISGLNKELTNNTKEYLENKKIGTKILTGLLLAIINGIMLIKFGEISNRYIINKKT